MAVQGRGRGRGVKVLLETSGEHQGDYRTGEGASMGDRGRVLVYVGCNRWRRSSFVYIQAPPPLQTHPQPPEPISSVATWDQAANVATFFLQSGYFPF